QEALRLTREPNTRFVWGEAEAGHLLGEALAAQKRLPEAQEALQQTLALRKRINDPASLWTDRALRQVEMQIAGSETLPRSELSAFRLAPLSIPTPRRSTS